MTTPVIISLEGNIGVGKSTFLEAIKESFPDVEIVLEPVGEWMRLKNAEGKSLLELFYEDKRRWAYTFQNAALLSRSKALRTCVRNHAFSDSQVFVTERSIEADKNVFAAMLTADGDMTPLEWTLYMRWYAQVAAETPAITGYIHLDTPVTICHERIEQRARPGEVIEVEYLDRLDSHHFGWLHAAGFQTPVLRYDTYSQLKDQSSVKDVEAFVARLSM
jgi:deoxyadenosine/deoxycytidine kinase